jgi:anti-anti-sigma factor
MLTFNVTTENGRVPVTVLQIEGQIDGQNYRQLIEQGRLLQGAGTRALLLDLGGLTYIGSAGLHALHTLALTVSGEPARDAGQEYAAQIHVKLLNPGPDVRSVLDLAGFTGFFEIFEDRAEAIASFS